MNKLLAIFMLTAGCTLCTAQEASKREEETKIAALKQQAEEVNQQMAKVRVEVIKKEKYAINHEDLVSAFKTANEIVNKYKMANSTEELLTNVKNELRAELSNSADQINRLKDIMLKNEVITLEDLQ